LFNILWLIRFTTGHRNYYSEVSVRASRYYCLLAGHSHVYHRTSSLTAIHNMENNAKINFILPLQKLTIPPLSLKIYSQKITA